MTNVKLMSPEDMSERELMNKIQQLLSGPAADWYAHKRRSIHNWSEFKYQLRGRFASANTIDDIRQQIYSKKQKRNEYTLRFIDQFVVLVNRLPERTSEYQRLKYILSGIRVDIARMARTANIRSVDELIHYVKENFGQYDKLESRFGAKMPTVFNSTMKNKNVKIELVSENEYEYSESEETYDLEMQEIPNKKKKVTDKKENRIAYKPIISRDENASNVSTMQQSVPSKQGSSQPDSPNMPYKNPCPFCDGDHFYKMCPLPVDCKPKHCFLCKSVSHVASQCSRRSNWRTDSSVSSPPQPNPTPEQSNEQIKSNCSVTEIECKLPPSVTYVESLIFFPKEDIRPYTTATINDIKLTGLLDTGSNVTVIGKNFINNKLIYLKQMIGRYHYCPMTPQL